jgi:hypothetical protein
MWRELVDGRELVEGGPVRFICHPKCNHKWVIDNEQVVTAFVRAVRAGRHELVFGVTL